MKPGARVRIVTDAPKHGWGRAMKGDIGIIRFADPGNPVRIQLTRMPGYNDGGRCRPSGPAIENLEYWSCLPDEIEVVGRRFTA